MVAFAAIVAKGHCTPHGIVSPLRHNLLTGRIVQNAKNDICLNVALAILQNQDDATRRIIFLFRGRSTIRYHRLWYILWYHTM